MTNIGAEDEVYVNGIRFNGNRVTSQIGEVGWWLDYLVTSIRLTGNSSYGTAYPTDVFEWNDYVFDGLTYTLASIAYAPGTHIVRDVSYAIADESGTGLIGFMSRTATGIHTERPVTPGLDGLQLDPLSGADEMLVVVVNGFLNGEAGITFSNDHLANRAIGYEDDSTSRFTVFDEERSIGGIHYQTASTSLHLDDAGNFRFYVGVAQDVIDGVQDGYVHGGGRSVTAGNAAFNFASQPFAGQARNWADYLTGGNHLQVAPGGGPLTGGRGNDRLLGSYLNDTLIGGEGNDELRGGAGDDWLDGNGGADTLYGDAGDDFAIGGAGDDVLHGGDGNDVMGGESGNDRLEGGYGHDALYGDAGADALSGGEGADFLHGGDGDDTLRGGAGADRLEGHAGADTLHGDAGNDFAVGGADDDGLFGGDGDDVMGGESGDDRLAGDAGRDALFGDDGNDTIGGGADEDFLHGGDGDDAVSGDGGDDRLEGHGGRDTLSGGEGSDFVIGGADNDFLHGGAGDDVMGGESGSDRLEGADGRDALYGDAGNDTIVGGLGADRLHGGEGADVFVFASAAESTGLGFDTILDLDAGADRIDLSVVIAAIDAGVSGSLSAATFDGDLARAVGADRLGAGHALTFTATGGDFAGRVFLIADGNGEAGYQAGADTVIELQSPPASVIDPGLFI